jgi:RNA polymerase sigma-70 factor, ECF subfamily
MGGELAKVSANGATFLKTGSTARLSDWSIVDGDFRERRLYASPQEVFEHDYVRLVQALTVVAGDKETAADAVQEAFVCLVRSWDRLASYDDPAGWVRRVALNKIRQHQRSIWRQARLLLRIEQQDLAPEEIQSFDPDLWEQLKILPTKQRTAVALHYVGGLTAREVAEVMHVSEGTVDQHLHRALQALRQTVGARR